MPPSHYCGVHSPQLQQTQTHSLGCKHVKPAAARGCLFHSSSRHRTVHGRKVHRNTSDIIMVVQNKKLVATLVAFQHGCSWYAHIQNFTKRCCGRWAVTFCLLQLAAFHNSTAAVRNSCSCCHPTAAGHIATGQAYLAAVHCMHMLIML